MSPISVVEVVIAVGVLGAIAAVWIAGIRSGARHERAVLKEHARAYRAHYAAVEAAEDDPSFSPDAIEQSVIQVVALAESLWHSGKFGSLGGRPDVSLIRAWARSRQSWLGSGLEAKGEPSSFASSTAMTKQRIASSSGCACACTANTLRRAVTCISTSAGPLGTVAVAGFCSRWAAIRSQDQSSPRR